MAEYLKRDDVLANSEILTFDSRDYGRIDVVPVEYLADLPTVELKTVKDVVVPNLKKHNIKRVYPDYSDKEVEAYIKGYEEKELEIYNKVMEDKAEETGLHLSIYTNNNAEYLIKKDVENVLQDWALKAWKDEWKPTWESIRGDTFMEAKLIVMDLPPINMSNFINKEDVLRIIESFKVGGNQKLSKEEFERNSTLQLIQDEIQGINGFEE